MAGQCLHAVCYGIVAKMADGDRLPGFTGRACYCSDVPLIPTPKEGMQDVTKPSW